MAEINLLILSGVLTEDAVLRPNNGPLSLNIKNTRTVRPQGRDPFETSTYMSVAVWGGAREAFAHLKEGDEVMCQGEIGWDSWEEDHGNKKGKTKMDCRALTQIGGSTAGAASPPQQQIRDDDIPF